jgi:hypothetical protein
LKRAILVAFLCAVVLAITALPYGGSAAGFSGSGSGTAGDPYIITTVGQLQEMKNNLSAHYALGKDIDASETVNWNGGAGFEPVGTSASTFAGSLDGRGYKITNLYINRSGESPDPKVVGSQTIGDKDLGLKDRINGTWYIMPENGFALSMTAYFNNFYQDNVWLAIYKVLDSSLVAQTEEKTTSSGYAWHTFNFPEPVELIAGENYWFVIAAENAANIRFTTEANRGLCGAPASWTHVHTAPATLPELDPTGNWVVSLYVTYTLEPPTTTATPYAIYAGVISIVIVIVGLVAYFLIRRRRRSVDTIRR